MLAGQSEKRLREVFEAAMDQARQPGTQPIVLFLDELDALCPRRDASRPHEARVVAQLLTLLDAISADPGAPRPKSAEMYNVQNLEILRLLSLGENSHSNGLPSLVMWIRGAYTCL